MKTAKTDKGNFLFVELRKNGINPRINYRQNLVYSDGLGDIEFEPIQFY